MRNVSLSIFLSTTIFTTLIYAEMEEAKALFDEAKCMECHENEDFKHRKEKVNSFEKLTDTIDACAFNNDTGWFDDEVHSVAKYLNKHHYHYKDIKEKGD